ncbi:CHAT domain-containing protein [Planctomicrobium sp. SH664]|uniref:CHAT domain-containing protein n=1 Tax=Planctomicrobium sp. SH664 TaxID=3448125 RepID=UPI003F5C6D4F
MASTSAGGSESLIIRLDEKQGIVLEPQDTASRPDSPQPGLWIIRQGQGARCLPLSAAADQAPTPLRPLEGVSRSESGGDGQTVAISLAEFDQLASGEVVRALKAGSLLTPADKGQNLNPRVTFRRQPSDGSDPYPADSCTLIGSQVRYEFPFPPGTSRLRWEELPGLPEPIRDGLPPGRYLLKMKNAATETSFHVVETDLTEQWTEKVERVQRVLGPVDQNLLDQVLVERLLKNVDELGQPLSYFSDAADLLDRDGLSPHLVTVREGLLRYLRSEDSAAPTDEDEELAAVNSARDLIARGQWNDALDFLQTAASGSDRAARLARLYRGVAMAESSATLAGDAEMEFQAALHDIATAPAADAYRIRNNYANFLLRRIQNELHNRPWRSASGAADTLFDVLITWQRACHEYQQACEIGKELGPASAHAAQVGLARHYALLADLLRVTNAQLPVDQRLDVLEAAARTKAEALAVDVLKPTAEADRATRAAAAETLAQLAHRQGNSTVCLEFATQALQDYAAIGSIVGAEGILRLRALAQLNQRQQPGADQVALRDAALQNLLASHALAEHLREQYPDDTIGLSRAGFLARRAYVTDRIVELLIDKQDAAGALAFLETAKARALQDMLSSRNSGDAPAEAPVDQLQAALAEWPQGTAGLEYFLGEDQAWVFVVNGPQHVTAHRLENSHGTPVQPVELLARVRVFLNQTEETARKLRETSAPDKPFDSTWQHELHRFWNELIPAAARSEIGDAKNVVIVPQHLLHYFPFAALVTELDAAQRGPLETVMPRFWIESGINLVQAPSFTSWHLLRTDERQTASSVQAIGISTFATQKPLPGVKVDLANLQRTFKNSLQLTTDRQATEGRLRQGLEQPGMIFIGTHGTNLPDQPLASYLICQPDPENDGYFMAGEIYGSRFESSIALLSACYTGLSDRSPVAGDELFGIERALLHAGVLTVVDGVWDVFDNTGTEIMNHVFEELLAGETTVSAVADAQRKFIQERRNEGPGDPWIHPYFWAVYKVSGSDQTRFDAN